MSDNIAKDILDVAMPLGELFAKMIGDALANADKPALDRLLAVMEPHDKMDAEDKLFVIECVNRAHEKIRARTKSGG